MLVGPAEMSGYKTNARTQAHEYTHKHTQSFMELVITAGQTSWERDIYFTHLQDQQPLHPFYHILVTA